MGVEVIVDTGMDGSKLLQRLCLNVRTRARGPVAGPRGNGIPELHKLTPILGLLQDKGHRGELEAVGVDLFTREPTTPPAAPLGVGRELFAFMRLTADNAEHGASALLHAMDKIG